MAETFADSLVPLAWPDRVEVIEEAVAGSLVAIEVGAGDMDAGLAHITQDMASILDTLSDELGCLDEAMLVGLFLPDRRDDVKRWAEESDVSLGEATAWLRNRPGCGIASHWLARRTLH